MKTFTLDEAQSLLPVLESLLKRAIDGKLAVEEVESGLSDLPVLPCKTRRSASGSA